MCLHIQSEIMHNEFMQPLYLGQKVTNYILKGQILKAKRVVNWHYVARGANINKRALYSCIQLQF